MTRQSRAYSALLSATRSLVETRAHPEPGPQQQAALDLANHTHRRALSEWQAAVAAEEVE